MTINISKFSMLRWLLPCSGLSCLLFGSVALAQLPSSMWQNPTVKQQEKKSAHLPAPSDSPLQIAQTPPQIPPGTIEPTRPAPPPLPEEPAPTPTPNLELPPPTPSEPAPAVEATVKLKRVEVLGSTVFSEAELAQAVENFIGREATFEQLLEIRTAITNLYTSKGYTTSGAFLPPQDATDGVLKIQVVEGELERIEVQGLNRLSNNYVRSRIAAAAKTPVNVRRLETALQLLQQNPLIGQVQAELTAGSAPGRSVLLLNLKEAQAFTSALIVDNRDSPSVGSVRGTAAINHNNLLGFGDRLSAEVGITEGIENYNFSYEVPLNASDSSFSLRYNNGNSRIVEQPFTPLDIKGDTETYALGFRQPLFRTPTTEFSLGISGELRRSQTYIFDDQPYSFTIGPDRGESKVSVVRFSQDWVNRSSNQVLAARSQFSFGVDAFDATINNTGTDGRFFSWLGQFQWVRALGNDATLVASTAAQLTGDSLLPLEQFSIGGVDTVRGYRTNQRVGDNGAIGSVEVRIPVVRSDGFGVLQVVPFVDAGTIWSNGDEGNIDSRTLVSTGLGLRWRLGDRLSARLDLGIPLVSVEDLGDSLQDDGIYFSVQVQPF